MRIAIVLPTYNESNNLRPFAEKLLELRHEVHLVVVDDASPDGTGDIADQLVAEGKPVTVIHRSGKLGLGSAYVEGFRKALTLPVDAIVQMDSDFSHDPAYVDTFAQEIAGHDLVIGSRYLRGVSVVNWPLRRLILSYVANVYARWVTGVPLTDLTGGFKCFRKDALSRLDLQVSSQGYAFQIEMNVKAWDAGLSILEIPVIFIERLAGSSKMSRKVALEAAWKVWLFRIKRKKRPPTKSPARGSGTTRR